MLQTEQNDLRRKQLKYLGLDILFENWEAILKTAVQKKPSYSTFLADIIDNEYFHKTEKARKARIKRAKIPEMFVLETFPFSKQPKLDKKVVCELHDSLSFMQDKQDLIFMGPTGCGKTGLATSFLVHAINRGFRGLFTDFSSLVKRLEQARGDRTEEPVIKKFSTYDLLVIDELGYEACNKLQASLFFDLIRRRHRLYPTIITTQLGFNEWGSFLQDVHMTAALLDRITVNCAVFNMKECISIRIKKIVYAVKKE
jgi:DNA replication protein DnaC